MAGPARYSTKVRARAWVSLARASSPGIGFERSPTGAVAGIASTLIALDYKVKSP